MTEERGNGPGRRARRLLRRVREADERRGNRRDLRSRRASEAQRSIAEALLSERSGSGGAEIPRDEWGVPLDDRHVRSELTVEGAGALRRVLSGPRRSDFTRPFRRKRDWIFLGVAVLMLPVLLYYLASDRLTSWSDPSVPIEGEGTAEPLWAASAEDTFVFDETVGDRDYPSRFEETAAVWPAGDTVVRADRAGVTSYAAADGEVLWHTDPGGEGLCTAAGDAAAGGVGVVVVEREGGDGTDSRGCDTVLGIDLSTGERLWKKEIPELAEVRGDNVQVRVRAWSAGGQAVVSWGPLLAGFDAAGGETPWTATELPGPDGTCPAGSHEIMPRGDGEAVLLGFCGSEGERPFTGLLDTATGEVSEQRALPVGTEKDGSDTLRLVAADPVVVYTSPTSSMFDGSRQNDELLVAADGDWTRIAAWGEAGVGAEKKEWGLDHRDGRFTVVGGVLYAETAGTSENRIAAFDLDRGEPLWDRRVEDHFVRVVGADGDRVLAVARTGRGDADEEDNVDPWRTRILALPTDGEGPAELVADDLPAVPWLDDSPVWLHTFGDRYVVGPTPDSLGSGAVPPLFAAG